MRNEHVISVIIPALNEAKSIGQVISDIPTWVDEIIVADNGSSDDTVSIVESLGARVVHQPLRGYGAACLRGIQSLTKPDIVVFLDGDYSDHPDQMDTLVDPIINDEVDMVIGSRALGNAAKGALTLQARFGNQLACFLMRVFWGVRYTDLGPFRAIRYASLQSLHMADTNYGWTVEMQIKATLQKLRATEVPVDYRKRIGRSKVSGTLRGIIGAGYKILSTLFLSAARYHLYQKHRLNKKQHLIIFTRYPVPGKTKTRLIPALGAEAAADLQRALTEHALTNASILPNVTLEIHYTGETEDSFRQWLGDKYNYHEQVGDTLGDRMKAALQVAFENGADHAVVMGIDCPSLDATVLEIAFNALHTQPLAIGPATDGGYYLIGMRRATFTHHADTFFDDMPWGTDAVYPTTVNRIEDVSLTFKRLAYLNDIDEPEDLPEWEKHQPTATKPEISIIIPTLNAEDTLEKTLLSISINPDIQVIVADGDSTDETCAIALSHGVKVIHAPKGRAIQMNIGAAHATADTLLFLHADTLLPPDYPSDIQHVLAFPNAIAGAFRFSTSDTSLSMRLIAAFTNLRARWRSLPYGDQGLFLTKNSFHTVGGFQNLPIMEDFVFVRALQKLGRIRIAPTQAITSSRRWQQRGPWRTTLLNQFIILAWFCGASPETLAKRYRTQSPSPPSSPNSPD